jgi:hypothetical protein
MYRMAELESSRICCLFSGNPRRARRLDLLMEDARHDRCQPTLYPAPGFFHAVRALMWRIVSVWPGRSALCSSPPFTTVPPAPPLTVELTEPVRDRCSVSLGDVLSCCSSREFLTYLCKTGVKAYLMLIHYVYIDISNVALNLNHT